MSAHAFNEDQLVEQLAIGLFVELGCHVACGSPHPRPLPGGEGVAGPPPTAGVAGEPRYAGLPKPEFKTKEQDSSGTRSGLAGAGASGMFGYVPGQEPLWAFGWRADAVPEPGT